MVFYVFHRPPEDNAKMALLMVILTTVFMKGNVILDSKLHLFPDFVIRFKTCLHAHVF